MGIPMPGKTVFYINTRPCFISTAEIPVNQTYRLWLNKSYGSAPNYDDIDVLMQESRNSIANALELRLSCINHVYNHAKTIYRGPTYGMGHIHYSGVILSAMASQITGGLIVCPNVYSGADQRKHQSSTLLALCEGRWPVNSPHKRASNMHTVSVWWRHHFAIPKYTPPPPPP